ncbi:hypothetical protein ACTWQL_14165 [Pseudalkalibacillus sp. R45]|uniref:hypothetical protein n=1 Tax=Pseudalkalibacillus sp. R45 TaxID=3457433 RepID=UPI003FCD0317
MENHIQTQFENLQSKDKQVQYDAYQEILEATKEEVDWAYEVWNELKEDLTHPDNHQRSRAAQFLANLAKSDPEKRMLDDFPALWTVTKDEKFVTARHSLQSIWRVGLAGSEQKEMVIHHLVHRFHSCLDEKNYTLIHSDILQNLKHLYEELGDEEIKQTAMTLIETVEDEKYKKKYRKIWK